MFKKVLVANRGEIAVRVMRTCKEMGIRPVAVYSDIDRTALHVSHAYEAYNIGPAPSHESYLDIERLVDAIKKSGADAVHPGYGFLSENAEFARAVTDAGATFIGPSEQSIHDMGNKLSAREIMKAAGVPMIPGSDGAVDDPEAAAKVADEIGYPVMIKAAAGGGGKGMRIVHAAGDFRKALEMTQGEAQSAFGDGSVYVERFAENPKHIEIQVMADGAGKVLTYGERECSMQRRYQKVIEESPSPVVDEKLRADLSDAARKAAQATNYRGAGTVEFILDGNKNFYFLEMNTRLQVEHPVTELVYGVDLVRQQIEVAAGLGLDVDQKDIAPKGHGIELRVYAEDPSQGFVPSVGLINRLTLPQGPGVRNDNGVYAGYEVPIYYDPMIGKISVWAEDREQAIRRAARALREYRADGIRTNSDFLLWALQEPGFLDGSYDTKYIEANFDPNELARRKDEVDLAAIAAGIAAFEHNEQVRLTIDDDSNRAWRAAARRSGMRGLDS